MRLFTKKWIYNILLSAFMLPIVISCSGGSSDPTPQITITPSSKFSLAKLYSTTPIGEIIFIQIIGSSTDGSSYTGSIKRTNRVEEMLGGILVTPSDFLLNLISGGVTVTSTDTNYIDSSGNHISSVNSDGVTCTPAFPYTLPLLVKVGDTGVVPTITCINNTIGNTTTESRWIVEDAGDGTILYIISGSEKDLSGSMFVKYKHTYNINSSGDIISLKLVSETVNGDIFTIESL